jgi:hypothetical protein
MMGIEYKWNEQLSNFVDTKPWMRPMRRCFLPMTIQYISGHRAECRPSKAMLSRGDIPLYGRPRQAPFL